MDQTGGTSRAQAKQARIPAKVKFAYAFGDMCRNNLVVFNTFFLLWFYTDVIRIPAAAATVIMLIARIWDAVNDPMMGVMVDRTRAKEGRCRFWLKYFSVPAGVCIILSYMVPELNENGRIIWAAVTYLFQGMAQTITTVPMMTLLARFTDDREERLRISQWKGFGNLFSSTVVTGAALPLATLVGGGDSTKGFFSVAVICGVLYAAGLLYTYFLTKGYEKGDKTTSVPFRKTAAIETEAQKEKKHSVKEMLGAVLQNKPCMLVCLTYIVYLLYCSLQGSTMVYYLEYNLKNTNLMAAYSVLTSLIGFLAVASMRALGKKVGNARSCALSCIALVIGYGIRFVTKDSNLYLLYVCWGIEGIATGLFASMIYQCILDTITYGKWKTGVNNQGVILSVFTFFQKAGLAIGGVVASGLLALVNYVPNAAEQTESVKGLFFAEIVTLPAIAFFILFFMFFAIYLYEKRIPQMQKEIEEREAREALQMSDPSEFAAPGAEELLSGEALAE